MERMLKALGALLDSYDAFYIENKYGDGTHKNEFDLLKEYFKADELGLRALSWIEYQYDHYYKSDYEGVKGTAFDYLKEQISKGI